LYWAGAEKKPTLEVKDNERIEMDAAVACRASSITL